MCVSQFLFYSSYILHFTIFDHDISIKCVVPIILESVAIALL